MNINKLSGEILDNYRCLDEWPEDTVTGRLCGISRQVAVAYESYESMRKYGFPLIHGTCAINPNDCEYWERCKKDFEDRKDACEPEGLAFRLADVVMYTLATMAELGLDIDAVIMAEHRYWTAQNREGNEE